MKEDKREKLVATAQKLFESKGFDGVKMRELADSAGVNKGLLHYYFKSKDAIFREVFLRKAGKLYLNFEDVLQREDLNFEDKIRSMVEGYFEMLIKNPRLPTFILSEINKNPELASLTELPQTIQGTVTQLAAMLKKEGSDMNAFQLLLSIISLSIFPFIIKPLIHSGIASQTDEDPQKFFEERKSIIVKTIVNSIK